MFDSFLVLRHEEWVEVERLRFMLFCYKIPAPLCERETGWARAMSFNGCFAEL